MATDLSFEGSDEEHSAGGVLIQRSGGDYRVCLVQIPTRGGNPSWRLPKGCIEEGETSREAALRETREETGCVGSVLSELSDVEYWYTRRDDESGNRVRVQKRVDFYLMEYVAGDVDDHDHEVDEAAWFPFSKALATISYDAERRVLQEAIHAWDAHIYRQGLDEDGASL